MAKKNKMANNKKNQIEDIFSETDKARQAASPKQAPKPMASQPAGKQAVPLSSTPARSGVKPRNKAPFYVLIVFVVIIVLGGGAVLVTGNFFNDNSNAEVITTTDITTNSVNTASAETNTMPIDITNLNTSVQPLDTDGDGLTDAKEKELGTNPKFKDTDGDSLFDREEVEVYKTDPLKKDTDGDGNNDGNEVASGSDPNGQGELLDLNKAINNL